MEDPAGAAGEADRTPLPMVEPSAAASPVSRRSFLGFGGALAAAAALPGCTPLQRDTPAAPNGPNGHTGHASDDPAAGVPQPGLNVPERTEVGRFLNPDQLALVTAVVARLIPGDEDDPGAVEAGAVDYIDRLLATHESYPQRTYVKGPFARAYEGDTEPEPENDIIWVQADELPRYGWQSGRTPREIYRMGLARLEALSQARHGSSFTDLADDDQDALLEAVEDAEDDDVEQIFDPLRSDTFFDLVLDHTTQGFLADPLYGGNRDLVGWEYIGFPGAQRAYSPQEMIDPEFSRPSQSLAQLATLHGDHGDADALGSIRRRHPNGPID